MKNYFVDKDIRVDIEKLRNAYEKIFKRKVEILKAYRDSTLVKSGLSDGEKVNLTRLEYYIDGMEVNPVE